MNGMKVAGKFVTPYADYAVLIFLLLIKQYIFARYAGLVIEDKIIISIGFTLLVTFWVLFFPPKYRIYFIFALYLLISLIIYADLLYFRYFHDFITLNIISHAKLVKPLGSSIALLIKPKDLLFLADLLIIIPFLLWHFQKVEKTVFPKRQWFIPPSVLLLAILFVFIPIHDFTSKNGKDLFTNHWWNVSIYNVIGHIGFHAFDVKRTADEYLFHRSQMSEEQFASIEQWFANHEKKLLEPTSFYGIAKKKNVLLIQLESIESFFIDKQINEKEITPHLNQLKQESIYFSNFYHQTGQGRTSDAEFLANTSLYPLPNGAVYVHYPNNDYDALPKLLKEQGYETYAFHAYKKSYWNRQNVYQNFGIDQFFSDEDLAEGEIVGWALGDKPLFEQVVSQLKKANAPFFAFVVALSSHIPFTNVPADSKTFNVTPFEEETFGDYLFAIHYVDQAIGLLVERLKEEGLWENTLVVFYGDHDSGIEFSEKQAQALGMTYDELAGYEKLSRVPLFLHIPGLDQNLLGEQKYAGAEIDLTPTICHLLGISAENKNWMGNNLLTMEDHFVILRDGSFTDGKYFYKASLDGVLENGKCFNVHTRKKTSVQQCEAGFLKAQEELSISDSMIYHVLKNK